MLPSTINPTTTVFISIFTIAFSGLIGLFIRPAPFNQKLTSFFSGFFSITGLAAAILLLIRRERADYLVNWSLPFGECIIGIDPLSSFFLLPIFLVTFCGSLYVLGYWPASRHPSTARWITFFFNLLSSSMALVVLARNGPLLLISWEIMALSAFFLLISDHTNREVRNAGVVYLLTTHTGTVALLALFALLNHFTGSFTFPAQSSLVVSPEAVTLLFLLALFGFGAKAGIMPMHFWLPSAHANAPSHGSAMMSGVMLKMGIYGILRFFTFLPDRPLWFGVVIICLGILSALLGICFAVIQTDIKRLLAYSSVENIGIIFTGIGMSLIGQTTDNASLVVLGLSGALLHILNHSFFKPLLFFGAGGIIHASGTRVISRMGGFAKEMPKSATLFFVGCLAICGLPPLNGFAGEFLLYIGFFREALAPVPVLALGIPALGLVGGMAIITFVKLYSTVFLGGPRTSQIAHPHELSSSMLIPMTFLAALCVIGGLLPSFVLNLIQPAILLLAPNITPVDGHLPVPASFSSFPFFGTGLIAVTFLTWLVLRKVTRRRGISTAATWGCGYLAPTPRIQYTGGSFSEFWASLTRSISRGFIKRPHLRGVAPSEVTFTFVAEETMLDKIILPFFRIEDAGCSLLRRMQNGRLHLYIFYIFITLALLMAWGK